MVTSCGAGIGEFSIFIPIPRPKKKNPRQLAFETEWTADRIQENAFINKVRGRVALALAVLTMLSAYICRIHSEEEMLRDAFGEEFEEYESRTWRSIPGVY